MTAPAVTLGTGYATETAAANHTIDLPAGTLYKGVWVASLAAAAHTVAGPSGWTVIQSAAITSARRLTLITSDAPTAATSVQVDAITNNAEAAAYGFSTDGDLPNLINPTWVTGSGTGPDPPGTGPITSGDYCVVCACAFMDARRSVTGYPTNYADDQATIKAGTSNNSPGIGHATRGLTAITSEDPPAFTLNASIAWAAGTIAIPEAGGGATPGRAIARRRIPALIGR